jgi:hypothetical protein
LNAAMVGSFFGIAGSCIRLFLFRWGLVNS